MGFHGRSKFRTQLQNWRFWPSAPASVDNSTRASPDRNAATDLARSVWDMPP